MCQVTYNLLRESYKKKMESPELKKCRHHKHLHVIFTCTIDSKQKILHVCIPNDVYFSEFKAGLNKLSFETLKRKKGDKDYRILEDTCKSNQNTCSCVSVPNIIPFKMSSYCINYKGNKVKVMVCVIHSLHAYPSIIRFHTVHESHTRNLLCGQLHRSTDTRLSEWLKYQPRHHGQRAVSLTLATNPWY